MKNLVNLESKELISTIEFRDVINELRVKEGEPEVRNNRFIDKVVDELDLDKSVALLWQPPQGGTPQAYFMLTEDEALQVGMRESKAVRKGVVAWIKERKKPKQQFQLPDFTNPAEAAIAWANEYKAKQLALAERDAAVATKAEIGSRREATAMNTASQAVKKLNKLEVELDKSKDYASVKRMEILFPEFKPFNWRELKATSQEMGFTIEKVFDQNYGNVNAYHKDVWKAVYNLDFDG